jgi:hypothetical protein
MIYLDSSVALAYLLAEDRFPPDILRDQPLVSSRLLSFFRHGEMASERSERDVSRDAYMKDFTGAFQGC